MPKPNSSNIRKVKVPPNTPERPITFLTKESAKYTYVYVAENKIYDPVTQYQKNERRCIGRLEYKLEADWKEKNLRPSEMIPNERYVEYFPEYLMIGDTSADTPTESDSRRFPEADVDDNLCRSDSVKVGQYLAINQIIEKLQIKTHLKNCFLNHTDEIELSEEPEEAINRILDFVAYMIIEAGNAAYPFETYAFEHALFGNPFSESAIGKLFASIDTNITNAFLKSWNAALIKENKRHETRVYVFAEGINGPCEAGNIEFAEYGADRVDDGNPVLGMMHAMELLNKLSVCYDVYYGRINDVSESRYMADLLAAQGYTDIGFVLDRGFFSIDNIRFFEEKGFAYIIMAKGGKPFIRTDFLSVINTFEKKTCNYLERFRVYGTTKKAELFGDGKTRYVHFYFNPAKIQSEQQAFMARLNGWEKALDKKQAAKEKIDRRSMRYMELYFNIEYSSENVVVSYSRNIREIDHEFSLAGYFAIITSENMTAEMALSIYKSHDVNEKLELYTTFPGEWLYRFQDDEHLTGKAFVTFIAMIIRQSIFLDLNDAATKEGKEWEYYTVAMAMAELGKISVARLPNGKYALRRPLTRRLKRILAAFKINERKIIEICSGKAEELNEKYAEEA